MATSVPAGNRFCTSATAEGMDVLTVLPECSMQFQTTGGSRSPANCLCKPAKMSELA
jgi:hypothetical protein